MFCIGIGLASPVAAQPPLTRAIDSIAAHAMARDSIPGMTIVVLRGAAVLHARGYGVADRGTGAPATERTVYQLGSISKQFAAAAVMRLVELGRVRLDDRVSRHLPAYAPRGDSIRLRDLLQQTSGIREEFTIPAYGAGIEDTTRPNAELLDLVMREPLVFAPGSRWSYSNSNYALLAAVIERASGRPYDAFVREELLLPGRIESIHHCAPLPTASHHARGYVLADGVVRASPPENMHWTRGDGGLCADAVDLARWARSLATGRVVSYASYQRMASTRRLADGTRPAYGFALSLVPLDGRVPRVSHGGRMAGFTGVLAYYPGAAVTVAALANRGGLWIESLGDAVARAALGRRAPAERVVPLTAAARRRVVGAYDIGVPGLAVRVEERDGRLWAAMPAPGPTTALRHVGRGTFVGELAPDALRYTFAPGGSRATRMVMLMAGMHWYGRRTGPGGPAPPR